MTLPALLRTVAPPAPDSELLARFVSARDEAAFAELVRRHGPTVYRVCRRVVGPAAADDAFQATFLVLATRADRVRKAASVGSWLFGVAGRVARQMRKRERRLTPPHPQPLSREGRGELATADLAAVLDDELTRLPDPLRAAVVACLVRHRTHQQAAMELGQSERTLRRRLDEAKRLLRERLERRGVVPAVALAVVSGAGAATAGVPRGLSERTVALVFDFLAGGAAVASAPAVIVKGVSMTLMSRLTKVVMASTAVGLTALGVGLAGDLPKAERVPPTDQHISPVDRKEPTLPSMPPPDITGWTVTVHHPEVKTKNFVVKAPDPIIARAVANEAEHQRKAQAEKWLGKELPAWKQQAVIEVTIEPSRSSGVSTFTYGKEVGVDSIKTQVSGTFEQILRTNLPHEVTHAVLATHFGKPLPRWADEGIALQSEPTEEQTRQHEACKRLLNAGRGMKVSHLLPMMDYPQDLPLLYAQGHSLVRFLLLGCKPGGADPHRRLMDFIDSGLRKNTPEGWDAAVKMHYGFAGADALQEAWIEWLRTPESALGDKPLPPAEKKDDGLIPPTRLGK